MIGVIKIFVTEKKKKEEEEDSETKLTADVLKKDQNIQNGINERLLIEHHRTM